jgi:hypothetical protein
MLAAMKGDVVAPLLHVRNGGRVTSGPWRDDEERGLCPGITQGVQYKGGQTGSGPSSNVRATDAGDR